MNVGSDKGKGETIERGREKIRRAHTGMHRESVLRSWIHLLFLLDIQQSLNQNCSDFIYRHTDQ